MSIHVTTFYSFKGGVGRTQALVNCAAWIACHQRPEAGHRPKVLMIDFDLEASGIQFVEGLTIVEPRPGIVDFIHDYLDHAGEVPDIANYVSQAILPNGVQVDVILAGDQSRYYRRFGQLRFDALWQRQHGSALFLDMKNQLEELGYEFMLVDSRTGLCDTSELCTLTLPDQVVVVFAPNRQNLAGTRLVIERIRQNPITNIVGVASRVRTSDDEQGGLRSVMEEFRAVFSGNQLMVVHEDPQQRVLFNSIAVVSYRRSALAKEYRRIARRIVARNPRSPHWALRVVHHANRAKDMERRFGVRFSEVAAWRETAQQAASGDSKLLWDLAKSHEDLCGNEPRVLNVDLMCGLMSLEDPPAEAVQWLVAGLEHGELGRYCSIAVVRAVLDQAIERALVEPRLEGCRSDALAYLVWNKSLHERLDRESVIEALCSAGSYATGACFGGFLGRPAAEYIMRCGDEAGVDWKSLGSREEARPWIRSAAVQAKRMEIADDLREPTTAELLSLPDWMRWACDLALVARGTAMRRRADVNASVSESASMMEQLRSFWLPGVEQEFVEDDGGSPYLSSRVVIPSQGRRPTSEPLLPIWNACGSADGPKRISEYIRQSDPIGFRELSWFGLVPSAAAILREAGEASIASSLELQAVQRLDAGADFGVGKDANTGEDVIIGAIAHARIYSPIHGSPISISELEASIRQAGAVNVDMSYVLRIRESSSTRVSCAKLEPATFWERAWHGWRCGHDQRGPRAQQVW